MDGMAFSLKLCPGEVGIADRSWVSLLGSGLSFHSSLG